MIFKHTTWCWPVSKVTSLLKTVNNILSDGLWKEISCCLKNKPCYALMIYSYSKIKMILCITMRPTTWCWPVSSVTSLLKIVNNILSDGLWKEIAYCFELNLLWVDNLILKIKWYYLFLIDLNFEIPLETRCVFAGNHYISATPPFLPHTLVVAVADGVFTLGTTSYCSLFLSTKKYTHPYLGCNLVWVGSGLILGKLTIKTTKFNPKPNGISNRNEPTQTKYLFLDRLSLVPWVSFLF